MRYHTSSLNAALLCLALGPPLAACDTAAPTTATRMAPPAAVPSESRATLSGQVFEVTPEGRAAAAGVPLSVSVLTGNCPGIPCSSSMTYRNTVTGPDGRYSFLDIPGGSAALFSTLRTHQQVCGAFTPLRSATHLDLEITSRDNPQRSPAPTPLRVTGEVYEMTPDGRKGIPGAMVSFDWATESTLFHIAAGGDGRFYACGIPQGRPLMMGVWQDGYTGAYERWSFITDTAVDIELERTPQVLQKRSRAPI